MLFHTIDSAASKPKLYSELSSTLEALIGDERDAIANLANTASLLYHSLPDVNWAGFYLTQGNDLVLGPFCGKPACIRIAFGRGVCGTAASQRSSQVVADVGEFGGHIACDPQSRAEIVVPLLLGELVVGVLDIDSPILGRFDDQDQQGLERVTQILLRRCDFGSRYPCDTR